MLNLSIYFLCTTFSWLRLQYCTFLWRRLLKVYILFKHYVYLYKLLVVQVVHMYFIQLRLDPFMLKQDAFPHLFIQDTVVRLFCWRHCCAVVLLKRQLCGCFVEDVLMLLFHLKYYYVFFLNFIIHVIQCTRIIKPSSSSINGATIKNVLRLFVIHQRFQKLPSYKSE